MTWSKLDSITDSFQNMFWLFWGDSDFTNQSKQLYILNLLFSEPIDCICMKRKTLCNCLCSSPSRFSASCIWDFGNVNWYSWFKKSSNMADWSSELSFFQDIHVRVDIRIDIAISMRPMITKFGKQEYLQDLIQMRLIK